MKRPRKTPKAVVIAARVEESFRARLWDACARLGLSESEAVRAAVEQWVLAHRPAARAPLPSPENAPFEVPEPKYLILNAPRKGKIK